MTGKGVEPLTARYSEIIIGDIPLSFFEIIQEFSWMNYEDF